METFAGNIKVLRATKKEKKVKKEKRDLKARMTVSDLKSLSK